MSSALFLFAVVDLRRPEQEGLYAAATRENRRLRQKNSGQTPPGNAPLLTGALAIALGLIGVHLAHLF